MQAKNEADAVLFSAEKALKDHGDKVGQDERQNIDRGIADLKEALKSDDVEKINKAKEALLKASHKLAEEIYKSEQARAGSGDASHTGQAAGEPAAEAPKSGGEDVVDAEVVDEKKK